MALTNLSSSLIQNTYQKLVQTEGGLIADGSGSAIDSLTVTASFATVAATSLDTPSTSSLLTTASFDNGTRDLTFTKGDSSTFAVNIPGGGGSTDTGSLMTTGSISGNTLTFTKGDSTTFDIDLSGITVDTGSLMTTGSISGATITFTKGDGTTFDIVVPDTDISALNAFTGSAESRLDSLEAETGSIATEQATQDARLDSLETETGSLQTQINNINTSVGALSASAETGDILFENIYGEVYGTSTAPVGGNTITISASSTKIDGATAIIYHSGSIEPTISGATVSKKTGTYDTSGAVNVITLVRDTDSKVIEYIAGAAVTSVASASYAGNAELLDNLDSTAFAQMAVDNVFTGTQTFNNIAVNGTGSFAYIQQVTGSAKVIGDAFLILNNDTPSQPYAGIKVQDSGSTDATASFFWNANTDDWMYEYEGDDTDHGVTLFGPEFADKDTPAYPGNNVIQKGTGGHHLTGSSLTDDGTTVSSTADLDVTGAVTASDGFKGDLAGNVTGNVTGDLTGDVTGNADTATSATTATTASFASTYQIGTNSDPNQFEIPFVELGGNSLATDGTSGEFAYNPSTNTLTVAEIDGNAATATTAATATSATSASYAVTASYAANAGSVEGTAITGSTTNITFDNSIASIYGTAAQPSVATTMSLDNTDALIGSTAIIYSSASVEPLFTGGTIDKKIGVYTVGDTNVITFVYTGTDNFIQSNVSLIEAAEKPGTNTTITFDNAIGLVYGTAAAPMTAATMSLSSTDALTGASAIIYHSASVEPLVTGGTIDKKVGSYDTSALNMITFVKTGDSNYLQNIIGASVEGIITNSTDTYTDVGPIQHIVALTGSDWNTISGSADANTFYVVT